MTFYSKNSILNHGIGLWPRNLSKINMKSFKISDFSKLVLQLILNDFQQI